MTQMDSHKINCPQCGNIQDTVVWSSLNVTLDPDLRRKLFNGEINVFVCEKCENKALINVSLLYHDMHRQYCVQYFPEEALRDPEFLKNFTKDGKFKLDKLSTMMGKIGQYMVEPHIVFDLNEMIRYIEFRDGLQV